MGNFSDKENEVTIFSRKKIRPRIDPSQRPASGDVPDIVYFVLPDGNEYAVNVAEDVIVGRVPNPDDPPVTVDLEPFDGRELGVSRHHAMIKRVKENLILVDLHSTNYTFINGERATPGDRYNLMDGDTVTFGRLTLEMRFVARNSRR